MDLMMNLSSVCARFAGYFEYSRYFGGISLAVIIARSGDLLIQYIQKYTLYLGTS